MPVTKIPRTNGSPSVAEVRLDIESAAAGVLADWKNMKVSRALLALGIGAMLGCAGQARATEFGGPKSYAVGAGPTAAVIADFNGDGKPDIAVVNSSSNNVSMLLGNGDGTFQAAKNFDVGNSMNQIAVGDFNGDGKPDVAVFVPGSSGGPFNGEIRILLGNGDGTLQAPTLTTLTVSAAAIAVGDFNGDKKTDAIVGNLDVNTGAVTLEILIGNGDGTFQAARTVGTGVQDVTAAVADFNNDGKLDLAVGTASGVQVLLGKGDGTFQSGGTANVVAGFAPHAILAADLNGEGRLDLIVESQQSGRCGEICGFTHQRVSVFLAEASGAFQSEILIFTASASGVGDFIQGRLAGDFLVGDFNGDGKNDLGNVEGTFEVRLGKGDGTFSTAIPFAGIGALAAVADLNGDKLADLIGVDSANNQVVVLLNDSPTSGADLGFATASGSPATVGVGNNLTYTADLIDEGPQDSTNVQFTDTLPAGVALVSASSSQGTCSKSQGVVTCDVGSLRFAQDATITIVVTPTVAQIITNSMSVSGTEPDLALANNSAEQTNTVVPTYTLTVTKAGAGTGSVNSDGGAPFNPQNGMIGCGSTCTTKFLSGTTVNLSAAGDPGDFFSSWAGACSGSGSCSVLMNSDQTVTANFVVGVTLSVTLAGSGSGMVEDQGAHLFVCTPTNGDCSPVLFPGTSVSMRLSQAEIPHLLPGAARAPAPIRTAAPLQ